MTHPSADEGRSPGIPVLYADDLAVGGLEGMPTLLPKVGNVDPGILAANLSRLTASMNDLFDEVAQGSGPFELSSFDVNVEITGSGEVRLIGAVSLQVTGGITLRFTRRRLLDDRRIDHNDQRHPDGGVTDAEPGEG